MNYEIVKRSDHNLLICHEENLGRSEMEDLENLVEELWESNLLLQLVEVRSVTSTLKLQRWSEQFAKRDKSFIIIASPSLQEVLELPFAQSESEALDILEMQEIERKI